MPRAKIIVETDQPAEVAAVEAWFAKWELKITWRADNQGCGCCVDIWEVDASTEALAALPAQCRAAEIPARDAS